MKNLAKLLFVVAVVSLIAVPSLQAQGKSGKEKVALWHNGHVINVAPQAVPAHLAHGDTYYGDEQTKFSVEIEIIGYATVSGTVAAGGSITLMFDGPVVSDGFITSLNGDYGSVTVESSLSFQVVITITDVQSNISGTVFPIE